MRATAGIGVFVVVLGSLVLMPRVSRGRVAAGDSVTPFFWSANQMADLGTETGTRVSPDTHMAGVRRNGLLTRITKQN